MRSLKGKKRMPGELPTKMHYFLLKTKGFFFLSGLSLVIKFEMFILPFLSLHTTFGNHEGRGHKGPIVIINSRTKT